MENIHIIGTLHSNWEMMSTSIYTQSYFSYKKLSNKYVQIPILEDLRQDISVQWISKFKCILVW